MFTFCKPPSKGNFSCEDVFIHDEITKQAVERILKSRRAVFLKKEVTGPCATIGDQGQDKKHGPGLKSKNERQEDKEGRRPEKMQATACPILVLGKVKKVKFLNCPVN